MCVQHFLGTFEDWLYQYVAGIQLPSASTAFDHVTIAPSPMIVSSGGLSSASAWTLTPFGNLSVEWTYTANQGFKLNAGVPVGVVAQVVLPALGGTVMESGKEVEGVERVDNEVRVTVSSGSYSFVVSSIL